jgi:hypothetical protein
MATADVDLVVARERIEDATEALEAAGFKAERFEGSINLRGRSELSVQISTEDFCQDFAARAVPADVHGILMRVASLEDTLRGKVKAWRDAQRRASRRQKDLADILRLLETHPRLRKTLPPDVAAKIEPDNAKPGPE